MAFQGFGKREESALPRVPGSSPLGGTSALNSAGSPAGSAQPFAEPVSPLTTATHADNSAKLTVGPNIKLKGVEITDCDTLVVEGTVEATMNSRLIQIAKQGAFKGSAEIDIAEVYGAFDGNLTARQKLVIHSTGKVTGKVRYGKIVIEEGGQLSGEITFGAVESGNGKTSGKDAKS